MMKYCVSEDKDEGVVSISLEDCDYLDGFIDIWTDDGEIVKSPFKDMDTAKTFAEIMVKLLEAVTDDIE